MELDEVVTFLVAVALPVWLLAEYLGAWLLFERESGNEASGEAAARPAAAGEEPVNPAAVASSRKAA